jgi:hypothetical protein
VHRDGNATTEVILVSRRVFASSITRARLAHNARRRSRQRVDARFSRLLVCEAKDAANASGTAGPVIARARRVDVARPGRHV